ncbi:MAG: precorrin-2 C(20)-methyltransferase [Pseudomonadota bacterium]
MSVLNDIAGGAMPGTLYGIGVGPGDPRYLTLRAAGLILSVDVVAYFAKSGRPGNARTIVAPLIQPGREEKRFEYPVTEEIPVKDARYGHSITSFYAEMAADLGAMLAAGKSVGLLSEGDPFFYGSFMHMWRRLKNEAAVEVVPGVTGMSGCWTRSQAPITWGDDILTVLPGTLDEERLTQRIRATDAAVVMKLGRNLQKVKRAVTVAGRLADAMYVERGTMADEKVLPLSECETGRGPYFSMIIIPGQGRRL